MFFNCLQLNKYTINALIVVGEGDVHIKKATMEKFVSLYPTIFETIKILAGSPSKQLYRHDGKICSRLTHGNRQAGYSVALA